MNTATLFPHRQTRVAVAALPLPGARFWAWILLGALGLLALGPARSGASPLPDYSLVSTAVSPLKDSEISGSVWSRAAAAVGDVLTEQDANDASMNNDAAMNLDVAWLDLLRRLEDDGFDRTEMEALFARLGSASWTSAFMAAKVTELHRVRGPALPTDGPAQPQLPDGYEPPVGSITVGAYKAFIKEYEPELADIRKRFGVPANVLAGLLLVETGLGTNLGATPAFLALASMAATTTPDLLAEGGNEKQVRKVNAPRLAKTLNNKSNWAYDELKALIVYGQKNNIDVTVLPGSVYGAIGICQFMPSNIEAYGYDGDGDGVVNLFSVVDAMYSAAKYLSEHGWRGARTPAQKQRVVMAYNQSQDYARKVLAVAGNLALAERGKLAEHRNPLATPKGRRTVTFMG